MTPWTQADIETLKALVAEGLSASQIAARMPGNRSRNSIIAKLDRGKGGLGRLSGKAPNSGARGRVARTDRPAKPPRPRAMPAPAAPKPLSLLDQLFIDPVRRQPEYVPNLPATLPITFLEGIERKRCLHYAGDPFGPDGPDMPVCGAERSSAVIDTRYCRRHLASERGGEQPRTGTQNKYQWGGAA